MKKMTVWEFLYCSCTEESASCTMSLHRTKSGAEKAMKKHKAEEKKKHNDMYKRLKVPKSIRIKFGQFKSWSIVETEVLD